MITANFWLIDSNFISRMHGLNTSNWKVLEIINDRFFVVAGASVLYQIQNAGFTGAGVDPLGLSDVNAVQHLNSIFNTNKSYWMK